jgi:hypothetical protein
MNPETATNLNLRMLDQAVDLVRVNRLDDGTEDACYMRTYPSALVAARATDRGLIETFLLTAAFVYGWLPASLRVDPDRLQAAAQSFGRARSDDAAFSARDVATVAGCLHSLVAAARILHFANPHRYPPWDPGIEGFRLGAAPSSYHMAQTENYVAYVKDVEKVKREEGFLGFHHDYCMNYQQRLSQLAIPPYPLTDMRVIESAVYEILWAQAREF